MKPFEDAVSLVIFDKDKNFLVVKRPDDQNDDIAGAWGFPTVVLQGGESHQDAAMRIGKQKLGVELELGKRIGDSTHDRKTYLLHLTDYEAELKSGKPAVPQQDKSVVQYADCRFTNDPAVLVPAAKRGSQCTQIYLESIGVDWH